MLLSMEQELINIFKHKYIYILYVFKNNFPLQISFRNPIYRGST